jgi:ferredoxin
MSPKRLEVNPVACNAFGHCAELLFELVALDEWGYPIIANGHVPDELVVLAERAVRACPTKALALREV